MAQVDTQMPKPLPQAPTAEFSDRLVEQSGDPVKLFHHPIGSILMTYNVNKYCSHCMRQPEIGKELEPCNGCNFMRFCSAACKTEIARLHEPECRRLQNVYPNLPMTEILLLSRIIDNVLFLEAHCDQFGWEANRKWTDLMTHREDVFGDPDRLAHFERLYEKMCDFRKDDMVEKERFFDAWGKVAINAHSIHSNAGDEIGMALDLGVSAHDHSCRPNCSMVFDGYKVYFRPLADDINPFDPSQCYISYIDVGRSKWQRRRELKFRWYFDCLCSRCNDPADDILTSMKCANEDCREPIITSEDAEVVPLTCPKCHTVTGAERVRQAQELMKSLPTKFSSNLDVKETRERIDEALKLLHEKNIYILRMKTAIFHLSDDVEDKPVEEQEAVFNNYKSCFHPSDRHNGFQLINIVRTLIESGKRELATPYAYRAMAIFEVCFGMEHPYYLQTLALWTFLEQGTPKSDEELLRLMNYNRNRRINLDALLDDK